MVKSKSQERENMKRNVFALLVLSVISLNNANANANANANTLFTEKQELEIISVIKKYLSENPEYLIELNKKAIAYQQQEENKEAISRVLNNMGALIDKKNTPYLGSPDAKVAMVIFFDYQCIYCSKVFGEVNGVLHDDNDVGIFFKDFPILGGRWDTSTKAAIRGIEIWKQKGIGDYMKYHHAIYSTKHTEGALTQNDINKASVNVDFDEGDSRESRLVLESNMSLAERLKIQSTPTILIFPLKKNTSNSIVILTGFHSKEDIKKAINNVKNKI
ncbi:TPA: thioredoxin domain-containing protein [Escherichia coli]|nr:thioredoxin domain-containing protein [Escherichia coli]